MVNKSSALCSNQLSYRGYQRAGFEPATLTSQIEVVLVYGTLFYFQFFKRRAISYKRLLTPCFNHLNYPFGAGLEPTSQFWKSK